MANFGSDDFSGEVTNVAFSAHTASGGGSWTDHTTGCNVSSAGANAYSTASSAAVSLHSGTPASADYTVAADMEYSNTSSSLGLACRGTDENNLYWARTTGTNWEIYKVVSGSQTRIGGPNAETLSTATYALVFSCNGTALELTSNGTSKVTATDSSITGAGSAGVRFFGNNSVNRLDNYSADDIAAGGASNSRPLLLLGVG